MDINLLYISHAIQSKIFDYIMIPELFQRLRREGRDVSSIVVAMVFIETRQILPDNMYILEGSAFKDFQLLIIGEYCDQITDVIARLYHEYIRSNGPKTGNSYQKTNTAIL